SSSVNTENVATDAISTFLRPITSANGVTQTAPIITPTNVMVEITVSRESVMWRVSECRSARLLAPRATMSYPSSSTVNQHRIACQERVRVLSMATPGNRGQNGYSAIAERMVNHCVSVNDSMLAAAPPKREPLPESLTPPNGTFGSSETVCSLIWILPESSWSASRIAWPVSPRIPTDRPYSLSLTIRAASSRSE